ncbi:MAG: B12-binding domain-containing radical SAM protein, partial [Lachnospiraceae bacterium]|nr:B12-binding domain-containing radical SAM protein [Lachnospiraceae bacterium]
MKRVLLVGVNAKYIHFNPAIYSLEAYARAHINRELADGALELVEYTINQNIENILADIYRRKPDIAAFSCYIWNWNMIQDILTELPKVLPDIKIWLGGPEVSFHGEQILKRFFAVQGIVLGEGEITFTELFSYYQWDEECGKTLESIGGLLLRSGRTGAQKPVAMDELPFFYEESEGNNSGLKRFENRILYYESQRGCPFSCAYCLSSIDKTVRFRSLEKIKKHMQFFLEQRVQQVKFIDRTFNCNAKHALEVWKYLTENDNGVTNFHFEIAADLLTKEQLEVMADMRPGLIQLEIGVQSTNKQTLQAIHRDMGMSHLREIVEKVHSFGNVHQHLDLIAGLPFEDYVSFGKSFDDVYA